MTSTIGVTYGDAKVTHYVLSNEDYALDSFLVIKDGKGDYLGKVSQSLRQSVSDSDIPNDMPFVVRRASHMDIKAAEQNLQYAKDSFKSVQDLIAKNKLQMKLLDIVFPLDRNFVFITFSAEERVDFRQLLKDLASLFKTRIELRQINSREEAKIFGGLGPCGRPLCCSSFLGEFPAVSIKMVRNQGLSLNSGKTTGNCGRLMCCLHFEDDFYKESKKKYPDIGSILTVKEGIAKVVGIDIFKETVTLKTEDTHTLLTYDIEEVTVDKEKRTN